MNTASRLSNYRVETASDWTETCSRKWPVHGRLQWLHPSRLCELPIWCRTEIEYGELCNEDVRVGGAVHVCEVVTS